MKESKLEKWLSNKDVIVFMEGGIEIRGEFMDDDGEFIRVEMWDDSKLKYDATGEIINHEEDGIFDDDMMNIINKKYIIRIVALHGGKMPFGVG